jgi:PPOX class probable F420-dependent enzyme
MIDERTMELANGANYAVLASVLPNGHPQTHMMWVDTDGEHIIVNTEVHRQKFKNIGREPRVTVLIMETGNPWGWSEVRGTVVETITGPEARAHIDSLAKKYLDKEEYPNPIQSERVIVKIRPDKVIAQ